MLLKSASGVRKSAESSAEKRESRVEKRANDETVKLIGYPEGQYARGARWHLGSRLHRVSRRLEILVSPGGMQAASSLGVDQTPRISAIHSGMCFSGAFDLLQGNVATIGLLPHLHS